MDPPTYVDITTKEFVFVETVTQEVTTVKTSNKIAISIVRVDLFNKATLQVQFIGADNQNVKLQILEMSGDDYTAWGTDDQYVVTWTLNKLGLSPSTQVVV